MHYFTLDPYALAVNDADPSNLAAVRLFEIVFDDSPDLTRRNRVQVYHVSKFDYYRVREGIERIKRPEVFALILLFIAVSAFRAGRSSSKEAQ